MDNLIETFIYRVFHVSRTKYFYVTCALHIVNTTL